MYSNVPTSCPSCVIVSPDHEMVVVITAGEFDRPDYDGLIGLVDDYMLQALE